MTTRIKIDLSEGILEVEGTEAFVKAIYNDFKTHFIGEDAVEDLFRPTKTKRRRTKPAPAKAVAPAAAPPPVKKPDPAPAAAPPPVKKPAPPVVEPKAPAKKVQPATPPVSDAPSYTVLEDLDLSAGKDRPSLVAFMDAKFPITNEERNLVFVHYLQNLNKTKSITIDHVYTCYKAAKIRVPVNIEKSLHMAANWINITKTGKLTVSAAGKRYVENQLPKKLRN